MAVDGVNGTSQPAIVNKDQTGFNALTSETFLKLLITQLQNQDPTAPVGNEELLQQLSSMRSLQSNIELSDTLKDLNTNQQITSGASFLGTIVTGTTSNNKSVTGVADRVFVDNGNTILGIGDDNVPVKNVTGVSLLPY